MASSFERLASLFPSAELHVIRLADDVCRGDLDAAIAQLIGWGCSFEPDAAPPPPPAAAAAARPQQAAPRAERAATAARASLPPPRALGCWTPATLTSWGYRPWLDLYASPCVPAAAVQYPRRYGQNFPATRHSRLSVCLADHEHAAEVQSCFALLPDSLMLHIACFSRHRSGVMRPLATPVNLPELCLRAAVTVTFTLTGAGEAGCGHV